MKANEFIKEYGLGEAVELVNSVKFVVKIKDIVCDPCFFTEDCTLSYKELKRLVESHELVKAWQLPEDDNDETGVDGARMYLECYAFYSTDEEKAKLDRLEQAIADVEACQ